MKFRKITAVIFTFLFVASMTGCTLKKKKKEENAPEVTKQVEENKVTERAVGAANYSTESVELADGISVIQVSGLAGAAQDKINNAIKADDQSRIDTAAANNALPEYKLSCDVKYSDVSLLSIVKKNQLVSGYSEQYMTFDTSNGNTLSLSEVIDINAAAEKILKCTGISVVSGKEIESVTKFINNRISRADEIVSKLSEKDFYIDSDGSVVMQITLDGKSMIKVDGVYVG